MTAGRRKKNDLREHENGGDVLNSTSPEREELRSAVIANDSAEADQEVKEAEATARAQTLVKTQHFRDATFKHPLRILWFVYCHIAAMIVAYLFSHFSGNSPGLYYTALTIFVLSMLFSLVFFILNRIFPAPSKQRSTVAREAQRLTRSVKKTVADKKQQVDEGD